MRKSLNFDLDTKKLKEHYPNKNYTEAYNDIKKFLLKNGFEHRQGSGYISQKEMSKAEIAIIIEELNTDHPWLYPCCKTLDYYDVGKEHNGLEILETISQNKTLEVNNTKEKEVKQSSIKQGFIPRIKTKTNDKDIER